MSEFKKAMINLVLLTLLAVPLAFALYYVVRNILFNDLFIVGVALICGGIAGVGTWIKKTYALADSADSLMCKIYVKLIIAIYAIVALSPFFIWAIIG